MQRVDDLHPDNLSLLYQALLELSDLLAHHGSLNDLLHGLAETLKNVVPFEFLTLCFHEEKGKLSCLHAGEGAEVSKLPLELPVDGTAPGWVWEHQQALICPALEKQDRFPRTLLMLQERGVQSYCVLPLTSGEHRIGALAFFSSKAASYREGDLALLQRVASLLALAVENFLTRQALVQETQRSRALLEVNRALTTQAGFEQWLPQISSSLGPVLQHEYVSLAINHGSDARAMTLYELRAPGGQATSTIDFNSLTKEFPALEVLGDETVRWFRGPELDAIRASGLGSLDRSIETLYCLPLLNRQRLLGTLWIGIKDGRVFDDGQLEILQQLALHTAVALDNVQACREIAELKDKITEEKLYLENEIKTELNFEQIIGESPALKRTLASAKTVATSDANVLILGETGTGKELIARAIHNMSPRSKSSFIKVNCAAIPTGLLESELFGHERGAFTGALTQKIGRLELANGGTLFLDEVGDIPLELQPKLLRVLQDHEFERLGSTHTIKVNVRLIAATNRDLKSSVDAREFRRDLYYRLNVFPIHVPPLRERSQDIPLLVRYFVQRFARLMDKPIESVSAQTMSALSNWTWPGNVRELENFIERSVILTKGRALSVPVAELRPAEEVVKKDVTLLAAEREHILKVLHEAGGVIAGTRGAAARLGLKRTTLQSKMQKLGIRRQDYEN